MNNFNDDYIFSSEEEKKELQIINLEKLKNEYDNDLKFLNKIFERFYKNFSVKYNDMITSFNEKNFKTISKEAHVVKGLASFLYAELLNEAAIKLEISLNENNNDQCILKNLNSLNEEFFKIKDYVKKYFK